MRELGSWGESEMGSNMAELRLDLNPGCELKTVSSFLREVSMMRDSSEKLSKLDDYVKGLEDEMRKIDGFKRELPLCMLLLNDAILRLREEAMQCTESEGGHVTEEFIPLKGRSEGDEGAEMGKDSSDKRSWMSCAQLWSCNRSSDNNNKKSVLEFQQRNEEDNNSGSENPIRPCSYGNRAGAFVPFKVSSGFPAKGDKEVVPVAGLSLMTPMVEVDPNNSNSKCGNSGETGSGSVSTLLTDSMRLQCKSQQQPPQQGIRKQRRCWSPELHRRFVNALQQLGGSQATPKQIRELMQVEGLTNDEVKSHLQKYRLHVRRIPSTSAAPANGSWVPQVQVGDVSKKNISQSGSPQGPLHLAGSAKGVSGTGGDSMEYDEDDKSEGHSWKDQLHKPGEDDV